MDPITQQTVTAAAGAGGGDKVYVDDVFSTHLYEGNNTLRSIQNGIDLSGEGGLVWIKNRDSGTQDHVWCDTERGAGKILASNNTGAEFTSTARVDSFLSDGFKVGTDNATNQGTVNLTSICSWTFRKAPGFFDVVTYTGNQTARTISHSLGSVPGMIIIKRYSDTGYWRVYHRSTGAGQALELNSTSVANNETYWNSTSPTSSVFSLSSETAINKTGETYVAYIFAHDDAQFGTDGDESIIKCGTFEGNVGTVVNLGFEPQWILVKRVDGARDWFIYDTMRGLPGSDNANTLSLSPNLSAAENDARSIHITSTGFKVSTSTGLNSDTHIYMAIRRPHKPPTAATEVFALRDQPTGVVNIGFVPDATISKWTDGVQSWYWRSRLTAGQNLYSDLSSAEGSGVGVDWDATTNTTSAGLTYYINYDLGRAPGFFDVVTYTGTNLARTVSHNLTVPPELMIIKLRNEVNNWAVYYGDNTDYMRLNSTAGGVDSSAWWNDTSPTSTEFTVGTDNEVNKSGYNLIAYLFATLPGISKVGSYTGTGNAINVDCGFTAGARFILIKRTDSTGDWYVWDSVRGYNGSYDNFIKLNTNSAEDYNINNIDDHLDALAAGFSVKASSGVNASGGTYIFLAIA